MIFLPCIPHLRGPITPTVTHFAAVLFACFVATMPSHAIRNAWDMMVWIVIKTPSSGPPGSGSQVSQDGSAGWVERTAKPIVEVQPASVSLSAQPSYALNHPIA